MTKDAPTSWAKATASAKAGPSSGLGLATVGKSPSGMACDATSWTLRKPNAFKAGGTAMAPVPCSPVYTTGRCPSHAPSKEETTEAGQAWPGTGRPTCCPTRMRFSCRADHFAVASKARTSATNWASSGATT